MFHAPEKFRVSVKENSLMGSDLSYGNNGLFILPGGFTVICSDGEGWEHVSVSMRNRCPNWGEMCMIKSFFWDDEDIVIQYHPKKSEYVNISKNCLHLWRPIGIEIPTPPKILVGI